MTDERQAPLKNALLEGFASYNAYERCHSGGAEEVANCLDGLRYDLRKVDDYIEQLELGHKAAVKEILELRAVVRRG